MWDDVKQLNAIAAVLAAVAVVALVWGVLTWAVRQPSFAFREVVIRGGLDRANPAQLETVVRNELIGTFFTMNLDSAKTAIARVPWVRSVALRRQWPQKLEVTVEEHLPLARWNDSGLVDVEGDVFRADYDGDLPQFEGPEERASEMASRFREWGLTLAPLALAVDGIRLSPRGGWRIDAKGAQGVIAIELGREDPTMRLTRFAAVFERTVGALAGVGTRIDHVDLRYRNGFAARVPGFKERARKGGA